jgi:hypothetical protein
MKVRGGCGFSSLMEVKKREKLRCLLLHRRKNFLFIYEVFVKQKIKKRSANHYWGDTPH